MTLSALIHSDLHRYAGAVSFAAFRAAYRLKPGFRWSFWYRLAVFLRAGGRDKRGWFRTFLFNRVHWRMWHHGWESSIDIPVSVEIGRGLKLGHLGNVVMQAHVKVGSNCLISHGVTIGRIPRGKRSGSPVIGDRVYIGPGAVVAGGVKVGNGALIAPNAFVNFDVPENGVVVGNPGKVVSENGTDGYIRNVMPEEARHLVQV